MKKLTPKDIKRINQADMQHEENFELTEKIPGGQRLKKGNFATMLQSLEDSLRFSQRDKNSTISYAFIAKVIRDEDGQIIDSNTIIKVGEE